MKMWNWCSLAYFMRIYASRAFAECVTKRKWNICDKHVEWCRKPCTHPQPSLLMLPSLPPPPPPPSSPPPNRQHSKGIKLGRKRCENLPISKWTTPAHIHIFSHSVVLDVLVELKALLIMHEINRKDAEKRTPATTNERMNDTKNVSFFLRVHVCACVCLCVCG